jgi:uncharacterized membrane protein HdeD (DUF308 family)
LKILLTYIFGFSLAWLGILSILAGLTAWPRPGAFLPVGVGLVIVAAASLILAAWVRQYRASSDLEGRPSRPC